MLKTLGPNNVSDFSNVPLILFGLTQVNMDMDAILNDVVSPADLQKFEACYNAEKKGGKVSNNCQFQYALCLVRSQYPADIQRGIHLLEDLFKKSAEGKRDCLYYLALGNARLKKYTTALKLLETFKEVEPNNPQVDSLIEVIKKKLEQEGRKGMLMAGGVMIGIGAVLGAGLMLAKK